MEESDKDKKRIEPAKIANKFSNENDYLEYILEKRFFKKFNTYLKSSLIVLTALIALFGFFGISKVQDFLEIETTLRPIYDQHKSQEELQEYKLENSHYYAYFIQWDERQAIRESIEKLIEAQGFGFADVSIEDALNSYLYYPNYKYSQNDACKYFDSLLRVKNSNRFIYILHNGFPSHMQDRLDSLFKLIYTDAEIINSQDSDLPEKGFLYFIYSF